MILLSVLAAIAVGTFLAMAVYGMIHAQDTSSSVTYDSTEVAGRQHYTSYSSNTSEYDYDSSDDDFTRNIA